ncbi:hypothetical protein QN400_20930 [Pseudomonas sp. RTC3]|uniref:hypothetical protein n=1 Tax=unclassified Pseudomonas TaxID=196821 RepID=UPI002AB34442|nr:MULTISPECIES: hypothetical protein [unclassified Pseudomonas]MEB0064481.1 hypothetical protein [Pseudomonas sp. RTC3]MDY7565892.1 hypothetical protein [Pseudomonas sp. 5C2]MEB0007494.1 hypothetical protein [Pseudomonas sp. RTB2]MEB0018990.1 hypothetical protein [Pseudomonas sp. RTB3]MEB0028417.1 hypothetical protein [Pseudomonas sp. MH9.2]
MSDSVKVQVAMCVAQNVRHMKAVGDFIGLEHDRLQRVVFAIACNTVYPTC